MPSLPDDNPYRVLYVSIIDQYKHQWNLIDAIGSLRKMGLPIVLDLVGPSYIPALNRMNLLPAGIPNRAFA